MLPKKKRYQILEKISEGQFGTVFKGVDTQTDQIVAIKKISVSVQHSSPAATKVLREIECMKKINHKNVVRLLDHQIKETTVKLVLEYMDYDLKTFIENTQMPLKNSKVKGIARMILEGLQEIHAQGILHRDLKPSNILINKAGEVKIGDLGSAEFLTNTQEGKFEIEGFSIWYKAPEILFGSRNYDFRVDIWSFACIFGELINGSVLFPGSGDFEQVSRIFKLLGSANKENWPDYESLPDYGKVLFNSQVPESFERFFPNAIQNEIKFIKYVLTYNRPQTIGEILSHTYFNEYPKASQYKQLSINKKSQERKTDYQAILNIKIAD